MARQARTKKHRNNELRKMLENRKREIVGENQRPLFRDDNVKDEVDEVEASVQEDIHLTLRQMRAETLIRIDAALRRLDEGIYGNCKECREEISEVRLRALPFAIRCKDCEDLRESVENRQRALAAKRPFIPGTLLNAETDAD